MDGVPGNGLLNSLVAYWPMDEASGNALDSVGGYTLTAYGDPGAATGKLHATARSLDGATQYFSRAKTSALGMGDTDWTFAVWCYHTAWATSTPYDLHTICSNGQLWVGGACYRTNKSNQLNSNWYCLNNDSTSIHQGGVSSLNTWYLLGMGWNAAASQGKSMVNATWNSADEVGAHAASGGTFYIGAGSGPQYCFEGRIGPMMYWSRLLSTADWAVLYNSGEGLAYSGFET